MSADSRPAKPQTIPREGAEDAPVQGNSVPSAATPLPGNITMVHDAREYIPVYWLTDWPNFDKF